MRVKLLIWLFFIAVLGACSVRANVRGSYSDVVAAGEAAISRGDFKTVYDLSLPYAEEGDSDAQFSVAIVMIASDSDTLGISDESTYHKKIIFWLKKSAINGKDRAAGLLADTYLHGGYGEVKDIQKAECWGGLAKELLSSQVKAPGTEANCDKSM